MKAHDRRSGPARWPAERVLDGADRRQGRRSSTCCRQPVRRSSKCRRLSARSGFRRWPTPPTSVPASRGDLACATRRSCPTSPGSTVPTARVSPRSPSSRQPPRPSAAGTSIRSIDASLVGYRAVCARAAGLGLRVRAYVSTAFGCPFEGQVPPERVAAVCQALVEMGAFEVSVSDTIGIAHPGQVPVVVGAVAERVPLAKCRAPLPRYARDGARQCPRPRCSWAWRRSTRLPAASAAAPMRPGRPATSRPKI